MGFTIEPLSADATLGAVPGFEALLTQSEAEDWRHLRRLVQDATEGRNTFDAPGEMLLGLHVDGVLRGVGGVNRDPYSGRPRTGRIRRVYVAPDARGRGFGRALVTELMTRTRDHFDTWVLRTHDTGAASFYEALGFAQTTTIEGATHERPRC